MADFVNKNTDAYLTALRTLRAHGDNRLMGLRSDRTSWWVHWREIADFILPRRYRWLVTPNQWNRGSPINQRIIDSTATVDLRILASGMMAGITSPGRPWFRLTLENKALADLAVVKIWCNEVRDRMLRVMAESNYYSAKHTQYVDLGCFGTAPMLILEDEEDVIRCFNPCAGEYYVANSKKLQVDTFYREFVFTVAQAVEEFKYENCSPAVQKLFDAGGASLGQEIVIGHGIEPLANFGDQTLIPQHFKWGEIYWEIGSAGDAVLRKRGYYEFPLTCPRWDLVGNDAYGRSPAMDALGDVKQLQTEQKRKAQGIDKQVNPPLLADVYLKNQPASVLPGGVTYVMNVNQTGGMKPVYQVQPNLREMVEDIEDCRNRIHAVFYRDLFMMISQLDTVRTATEIDARREEKLIQLGPVLERFENESLDPDIDRIWAIMVRARLPNGEPMIPPAPKEIANQHLKVEYTGTLAQMQKAAATAAIERLFGFAGNLAGAIPEVLDKLDSDTAIDVYADALGVDPHIVRSTVQVLQIRQQRAQRQAEANALDVTQAGVEGAQTLSQTPVGGGVNALELALGSMSGQTFGPRKAA